jgi:hypothetical protein
MCICGYPRRGAETIARKPTEQNKPLPRESVLARLIATYTIPGRPAPGDTIPGLIGKAMN